MDEASALAMPNQLKIYGLDKWPGYLKALRYVQEETCTVTGLHNRNHVLGLLKTPLGVSTKGQTRKSSRDMVERALYQVLGRYRGSRKEPDGMFKTAGLTMPMPTLVVETGWSESRTHLRDDMDLWLVAGNGAVKAVLILIWRRVSFDPATITRKAIRELLSDLDMSSLESFYNSGVVCLCGLFDH
ncbi:hypothetical protein CNMCM5793_002819 [Aspergillus hiratsukae]|uniref:Uncharacterized protein n=1 Tax=Aspergillus hiratsukae TaxID=1194566 RepID=A0A8H6UFJ5_9EURO|nr:hypothetical protein CNMCM5793_002819 [Aspergillus hiratsukae]